MNEYDVMRFIKRFPDKINPPQSQWLKSTTWKCSFCGIEYHFESEVTISQLGACNYCGGTFWEVI